MPMFRRRAFAGREHASSESLPMPIEFECGCGKKLTAKEEFVGRRLRCPGCQAVLTIPKSSLMATPVVPPRGSEHGMDVLKAATAAMAGKPKPLPPVAGPK